MMKTKIALICPYCAHALEGNATSPFCMGCGRRFASDDGVIVFLDRKHDFYEGAYENQVRFIPRSERLRHVWPLWLINSGYAWSVRQHVPAGSTVVELGCAGGVLYFGQRYRMIGCDLSLSSLKVLGKLYELRLQADASRCIPLPDGSVDAVVSSYFWEHIPPAVKPGILAECRRILKPRGQIIFLYDVETRNPLIHRYKAKDPGSYNRLFIEGDGHRGYQEPQENLALFQAAGFDVAKHKGMEKTCVVSPSALTKMSEFGKGQRWLALAATILGKKPMFYLYTVFARLIDESICRYLPPEWARIDLVVCRKQ